MNAKKIDWRRELYLIAEKKRKSYGQIMCWSEKVLPSLLGQEVYQLSLDVRGVLQIGYDDVLLTFFTDEAAAMLLKMPNLYWFWRIVELSILRAGNGSSRLTEVTVLEVMERERETALQRYPLDKDVASLSQWETAMWVAAGLLIVSSGIVGEPGVALNPAFGDISGELREQYCRNL